ncbi:hypothetical protein [Pseudonocardia sp. EV170527-09]|uniref:hypothetical protein n=1 Tax=Pseudonocardia sp. EV170527-09 TaxID=2603411 RepID=UPI001F01AA8E|nr:hypothetical protein [Pseudonocardia sp. EV170527-09]
MDITTLAGQDLLIVGGGSGIARALAADAVAEGRRSPSPGATRSGSPRSRPRWASPPPGST